MYIYQNIHKTVWWYISFDLFYDKLISVYILHIMEQYYGTLIIMICFWYIDYDLWNIVLNNH